MKIMYILDSKTVEGGAPISTNLLSKELNKKDVKTFVLAPNDKNNVDKEAHILYANLSYDKFPFILRSPIKTIKSYKKYVSIIKKNKPDIIHFQMIRSALMFGIMHF